MVRETSSITTLIAPYADENYKHFQERIIPNCNNILGVRAPILRKIAKQSIKDGTWKHIIQCQSFTYMEEIMLQGMIIGYLEEDIESIISYIKTFLPHINNWEICDIFVSSLKCTKTHSARMYDLVKECLTSENTYTIRFGIVMLIQYYVDEQHIEDALTYFSQIKTNEYYIQMAIAWALSIYYISFPKRIYTYLQTGVLDYFTHQKTISKIRESKVVTQKQKDEIALLRKKRQNIEQLQILKP